MLLRPLPVQKRTITTTQRTKLAPQLQRLTRTLAPPATLIAAKQTTPNAEDSMLLRPSVVQKQTITMTQRTKLVPQLQRLTRTLAPPVAPQRRFAVPPLVQ